MDRSNSWRRLLRRRFVLLAATSAALVAGLAFMLMSAGATVPPSGFEGNDGNIVLGNNLTPPDLGTEDWVNVNATPFPDKTDSTDDSLGKGSKEDDDPPTVVTQSVPPKDDFKNVFLATEHIGGDDFLYESSIRSAPNGSANLNVELNQGTDGISSNGVTLKRVPGDRLITFDFTSGGTVATITVLTWGTETSDPGATCADTNDDLPCWIDQMALDPSEAEGAANDGLQGRSGDITAAGNPLTNEPLKANTFQEMSINLTDTGILPPGTCTAFASTTIKSRSSGSQGTFNSALKDLVIANKPISNCGSVTIHKEDDAGAPLEGVKFDLYEDVAPIGGSRNGGGVTDPITNPLLTCTTDADGDCTIEDVPLGDYWAVEDPSTIPAGHGGAADQHVGITAGGQDVALTFVDPRQPGTINIHKVDDTSPGNPISGVTFHLYTDNAPLDGSPPHGAEDVKQASLTCTTDAAGDCTISNVPLGQYWVVEDPATLPADWAAAPDQNVSLQTGGQSVDLTFNDPRKHRVIVLVCHQGTNTLHSGNVTLHSVGPQGSISGVPQALADKGVTQDDLCSTATGKLGSSGAVFNGLGHATSSGSVAIPGH